MPTLLDDCILHDGTIDPYIMAEALSVEVRELGAREHEQVRLRAIYDILSIVRPWTGSSAQAWAWYRFEKLVDFDGRTPEGLVRMGHGDELRAHLEGADLCAATPDEQMGALAVSVSRADAISF